MSVSRRGFLGALMASIVGVATIKPSDLFWQPAGLPNLPLLEPQALVGFDQFLMEVSRSMADRLHLHGLMPVSEEITGLCEQWPKHYRIACLPPHELGVLNETGLSRQAYVDPIAAQLAQMVKADGVHRMARLPLPLGVERASVVTHPKSNISLRGVYQWSPLDMQMQMSVDLIGAAA